MKKTFRSALTFALALVMVATCMVGTAFAASSDSTTIEGSAASANVSYTRTSETATTKYGGSTSAYVYEKLLHTTSPATLTTIKQKLEIYTLAIRWQPLLSILAVHR